jgi:hypothetical protein
MCEEGLASSLLDAMQQPLLLAGDVMWMRAYAQARRNLFDKDLDKSKLPNDAPHQMAKAVQLKQRTGRWPWEM